MRSSFELGLPHFNGGEHNSINEGIFIPFDDD